MRLDDTDLIDDGDGGGDLASSVSCSICLEVVSDNGERSRAKLQCGHEFHLDCIGSAFNIKGAMQCPNCRKVEKGQWLYAGGSRPFSEISMDDWPHDEDLYDLGYSEMSLGVHWCPFSGLTRLSPSFDEGEFSSTAYPEFIGQHALFAEHTAVSSASHTCPYITYLGPVHPSSSNPNANGSDVSNVNSHWNGPSVPSELHTSYTFPTMDVHYQSWEHHSPAFPPTNRMGAVNQHSIPPVTQRAARANSDVPRTGSFLHPFLIGHGSSARGGSSVAASIIPPGSASRVRERVHAIQAYFQQSTNSPPVRSPVVSVTQRSGSQRGLAQVGPVALSSDQTSGFVMFPSGSSGANFQEMETPVSNRFHAWEREQLPLFPLSQVNRDPGWGIFHQSAGAADAVIRPSSLRQRQGSERMPSQHRS